MDDAFRATADQWDALLGSFVQALLEKVGVLEPRAEAPEALLTVAQVASYCQVQADTVREWVKRGALRRVPGLRSIRIEWAELKAFLARPAALPDTNKAEALVARLRTQMGVGADAGRPPAQRL